jgi:hypothetical protein
VNVDQKRKHGQEGEMHRNHQRRRNVTLWVVQGLLAALFLFAGGMKLITPTEVLSLMSPFPGEFIKFIGACEVLGALGLVLPWALGIRRELTPLAAAGLVIIMVGATVSTLAIGGGVLALVDVVIGVLAATVAHGRREALSVPRRTAPWLKPAAA